ncbi:MAG TPA: gliding motility lipoprotein GldH [Flavisolibacter sp.]
MFGSTKASYYLSFALLAGCLWLSSCQRIDLYERVVSIRKQEWQSSFKPQFKFSIRDTAAAYQVYILLRHNEKYEFNNIWVRLYAQAPGDTARPFSLELPLANNDGWMGTAMDDLYDHRIAVTLDPAIFNFKKPGEYTFTLEQIMRKDPLENVLNVGLRIEKKP